MKRSPGLKVEVLRVEEGPEAFVPLMDAMTDAGLRLGWLELAEPEPLPPSLVRASGAGALRAVAVGSRGSVAVKARRGAPVLGDVLREHFLGCRLVLVRGEEHDVTEGEGSALPELPETPRLVPASGGSWRVESTQSSTLKASALLDLTTEDLIVRLRRPRPWE